MTDNGVELVEEETPKGKTNGVVTRPTMASGNPRRRDNSPRVHSVSGVAARASRRLKTFKANTPGHHKPGSRNPRKVGRG